MSLPREGWTYLVLAPVLPSGLAVIGDVDLFVPAGDARIEVSELPDGARVVVKGAGEVVTVTGWAPSAPAVDGHEVAHDPGRASGRCGWRSPRGAGRPSTSPR